MANQIYLKGKEALLGGNIALDSATIKCALVDTDTYTPNFSTDEFLSDLSGITSTSPAFTTVNIDLGVFDADDITFPAVSGAESEALVIYQDTGTAATSRLVSFIDTASGLPVTPNGTDIIIRWDNGANKIFKL